MVGAVGQRRRHNLGDQIAELRGQDGDVVLRTSSTTERQVAFRFETAIWLTVIGYMLRRGLQGIAARGHCSSE